MRFLAVPAALLLTAAPAFAGPEPSALSDRMLVELVAMNGVPGMGAAVWQGGRIGWTGSAGYRDVETRTPVDANTIFRLASVSKLFAVTAAAKLREANAFDVDASVVDMIPALADQWPAITPRQLAAHVSGMPHYNDADNDLGRIRYASVADAVRIFNDRPLASAPGTQYRYSSWGFVLLSAAIEARAGQSYLDYLASSVTAGLAIGPDATGADANASKAYEFVDGLAKPAPPYDVSYMWAGGGLGGTPSALASFGGRMLEGRIVKPTTFAWMLEPALLADGTPAKEADYTLGFGWRVGRDADGATIAHHAGIFTGARSAVVLWPDQTAAVSLLSNAEWVSSIEPSAMMLAAPFRPAPAGLVSTACPIAAARYSGSFGDTRIEGSARFRVENGVCVGDRDVDNALGKYLNDFMQKDTTKLRVIGLDGEGIGRAALVTPIGLHDFRAATDGGFNARITRTRSLTLSLSPN